ncbi:MAG: ABC transporter ATP-binding protein [Lachnospiraceae bacterium]|nr:ABC transporter ATP-binding protein [Lachnospiraceae bacterium]
MKKQENVILKIYKYFLPTAWKRHKIYFIVRFLRLVVMTVMPFVNIMVMPLIVDEMLTTRSAEKIFKYVVFILASEFVLNLLNGILGNVLERYTVKFENYYKTLLSARIMELDFQLTEDKKALDQMELAKNGMTWYSGGLNGIVEPLFNMASALFTVVGVVIIVATQAPILILITTAILVLSGLINNKLNQIEQKQYAELSKTNRIFGYLGWELTDFRYGKDIRLYGAKDMMVDKWNRFNDIMIGNWKTLADKQLPLNLLMTATDIIRDFGTYFYLGVLAITGRITIGIATQMFTAAGTFYGSMRNLVWNFQELNKRANYANEYVKFMDYPAAIQKGDKHVTPGPHTFEFKDVSFSYPGADVEVLRNINLTLTPGEHLSVVGLNGAGKTTLVKLLCRLYDPTKGVILMDGVDIKEYDYEEYMTVFAPVFQDFKLFAFTMKENILMEKSEDETQDVTTVLERVGLAEKLSTLSNGADTVVYKHFDKDGIEPSGGEQQKLAIARALYKNAPVVILDEPTAALDPMAEYDIYRQFDTLVHEKTAIYISHRLSSCQFCDKIAVFSEKELKEYGTHAELVNKPDGVYAKMFAAQAQYYVI